MEEANRILKDLKQGKFKPIYFLMGEEPYFIDLISGFIEKEVLAPEERDFNQTILYGRDVNIDAIVSQAKRYPMMAERQVVIVKEAQTLSREIEKLEAYAENPQPSTILVICYKYKKLDKRKKVTKNIAKSGIVFESKKLYENQVGDWIRRLMSHRGYQIDPKAAHMLVEFLGTDLGKINNELEKLCIILPPERTITPESIEENIGISKDFNNFELRKAIGARDVVKSHRIVNYFAQNPKDNPMVLTIGLLFGFFQNLMIYHGLPSKDKNTVAKSLSINPYFVSEYVSAAQNYPMRQVSHVINLLRDADVKSKGVGAYNLSQGDLLKELLVRIMN